MFSKKLRIKTNSAYLIKWMKSPENKFNDRYEEDGKTNVLKMGYFDTYSNPKRDHIFYPFFDFSAKEIIQEALETLWENQTLGESPIPKIGNQIEVVEFESKHIGSDRISANPTPRNSTPGNSLGIISIQDLEPDITLVEFISNHPALDIIFKEMIKRISALWVVGQGETKKLKTPKNKNIIYVPTQKRFLERWKKIYSIYLVMKKEYKQDFDHHDSKNPYVTKKDLAVRVGSKIEWIPSEKTLERIIKAGDAGLLKK
jgi:hypothetical protein